LGRPCAMPRSSAMMRSEPTHRKSDDPRRAMSTEAARLAHHFPSCCVPGAPHDSLETTFSQVNCAVASELRHLTCELLGRSPEWTRGRREPPLTCGDAADGPCGRRRRLARLSACGAARHDRRPGRSSVAVWRTLEALALAFVWSALVPAARR
jgi:hypothetical protein